MISGGILFILLNMIGMYFIRNQQMNMWYVMVEHPQRLYMNTFVSERVQSLAIAFAKSGERERKMYG